MVQIKNIRFIYILIAWTAGMFTLSAGTEEASLLLQIDTSELHQKIDGFGASDAWNTHFVGKYWSEQKKSKMAQTLFSKQMDATGTPLGIGLSIWRFNIGAGSDEQGLASEIRDPTRRAECFLNPDGTYDWTKQSGQQWFLEEANRYGVETLVAFSNSPPVSMTRNGIAHGSGGFRSNLRSEKREAFADFLCDVLAHFDSKGIQFDYISPINEPQYQWETTKQEGSPWTNQEVFQMVSALDAKLSLRGISSKILTPEAADWRNLYERNGEDFHSFQIEAFHDPESPTYLGGFRSVGNRFAVHSYWTNSTEKDILNTRHRAKELADEFKVELHQTEYSFIALDRVRNNAPRTPWQVAQFIAKIIHFDLTEANVASWSFWTAMATDRNGLNRYLLLELHPKSRRNLASGGDYSVSKNLAALGHYSRFIRPGYRRVETKHAPVLNEAGEQSLLASAYLSPDQSRCVSVISNLSDSKHQIQISWHDKNSNARTQAYFSDKKHSLQRKDSLITNNTLILPPQSIVTLVSVIESDQ